MIQSINQAGGGQGGGATDEKVKVSANDTTEGYLNGKLVAGTGITLTENNNGGDETLTVASSVVNTDEVVKVSSNDTTAGFLNGKLVAGTNITFTENNNGSNETLTIAASGLTGFAASQNTASPNNTVNASRLLVDAASTNADAVIQPKGTGALLAQLPNAASTGGNKRGTNAVDLQSTRDTAAQVASGTRSVIIGGQKNTSTGNDAISGGDACTAQGNSSIALGNQSTSQGFGSTAIGVLCGVTTNGYAASAIGYQSRANNFGQHSHSSGAFTIEGDCQYERYVLRRTTTTSTPAELTCDGQAGGTGNRIGIANDSTYTFIALVTARRTDADNESAGYKIEGVIDNNAGTTAFVGTPTVTVISEDTAAWDVTVTADNTNDALVINVTGENAKTIRWGAVVELMKVSG